VVEERTARSIARWGGSPAPGVPAGHFSARLTAEFLPDRSGPWEFGLSSAGQARLYLDGNFLVENVEPDRFYRQGANERLARIDLEAGSRHRLEAEFRVDSGEELAGVRIGARPVVPGDARQRAATVAAESDLAIVVVGYDAGWEAEGSDRPHMDLPGEQNDLIRAVAAANPRTAVVLNAGAPVTMPWADEVGAIVQLWFPGMEGGNALGDVLFGEVDASGRLPTTFPRRLEDTPAYPYYPGTEGVVRYQEGVFVGYRHYDARGVEPRFCFGHGLSYTRFTYGEVQLDRLGEDVRVHVDVTNVGQRAGREVVQLYTRALDSQIERPDRELRDFAKLELRPGETQTVSFLLEPRAFAHWDEDTQAWAVAPGEYEILVGSSSRDIRQMARVPLP
jgi:beta-glucosidase